MKAPLTKIILNIILILITVAVEMNAQQIISKQILLSDQLSTSESTDIFQDKEGFIWLGTHDGIVRYDGYNIRIFRNSYKEPGLLASNIIHCFTEDDTCIWVGTENGINLIDKKTLRITSFSDLSFPPGVIRCLFTDSKGAIWIGSSAGLYRYADGKLEDKNYPAGYRFYSNSVFEDRSGDIWVLTWFNGIHKYSEEEKKFVQYPAIGTANNPFRMYQDKDNRYWVATWGDGLWRFDPDAAPDKMYIPQPAVNSVWNETENIFYDIIQDDMHGYIWALSYSGLKTLRINADNQLEQITIRDFEYQPNGIPLVKAYTRFIKDRDGNLWLNSYNQAQIIFFNKEKIRNYRLSKMQDDIGLSPTITCFGRDDNNIVWFNQDWYGLCLFIEDTGQLAYGHRMGVGIYINQALPSRTEGTIWLADAFFRKVFKMTYRNNKITILDEIELTKAVPDPGPTTRMVEDRQGNLWIGTHNNLFVKAANDTLMVVEGIAGVTDITEDEQGRIWVSNQHEIRQLYFDSIPRLGDSCIQEYTTPDDYIKTFCVDTHKNIWFATSMGRIFRIDGQTGSVTDQFEAIGLDGERILRLLSHGGNVWVIQSKRIIRHTQNGNNHLYNISDDNIFVSSFRYGEAFIDSGKLYVAGAEGYVTIEPTDDSTHLEDHKVLITDIRMDGNSMLSTDYPGIYPASVNELTLPPDARNIEVDFSALNYQSAGRMEYAYYLEGGGNQWTYLANGKHTAHFSRLNKGKYTLLVKSRYSGDNWPEEATCLMINRLPALYETWYAQLCYGLFALLIVFVLLRMYIKKLDRKNKIKFQEELTQAKLNYFTNISHELLTPLTVISCVADDMEENAHGTEQQVGILRNNVGRLKRLLIQILDFRKVESNNMPLRVTHGNVSTFIAGITASNFEYLAQQKNIRFPTRIAGDISGYVDFEKLDKMLFNLLSNAIKYTPEGKKVELSAYTTLRDDINMLVVEVADEGIGIDPKDIGHIFTKFYNNRNRIGYESNGIGLSLTKELVTLHHGAIRVQSEPGRGSVFTIELPLDINVYSAEEIAEPEAPQTIHVEPEEFADRPSILYVDDNKDLRELMKSMLQNKYQIFLAADGEEGLELVDTTNIDVIICDLMMPRMDGLEFCRRIKSNVQTSHIPVLMLTAKNTPADQVESYKAGVESFITKPFDRNILDARIDNLLSAREVRQRNFRMNMGINISNLDYQSADEQFLNDAIACIENNLEDTNFDIPQMAQALNVSKSTLSRKLKVITDLTPGEFVRNIKLKHACNLFRKKSITISEVAYATGFNNPKYFSKCFKDEFGMTPTEYLAGLSDEV